MDKNSLYYESSGGVSRGRNFPDISKSRHGDLFIWLKDDFTPQLMQYNDILKLWKPISGGNGVNGGVFFVDAYPTNIGNVGNKEYVEGDIVLKSIVSDTDEITFKVLAITGHTNYKPVVKINNTQISLTPLEDKPLFEGVISLNVNGISELLVVHEDGATNKIKIIREDIPKILSLEFTGDYPNGQTELKENDKVKINIKTDSPIIKVEIADYGACKSNLINVSGEDITIDGIIANRGSSINCYPCKIRVQKASGSWSEWVLSNTNGSIEKKNVVKLNNTFLSITINNITYPTGQQALKDNENAIISHTISDYDEISYSSPNGELLIENPSVYETNKKVSRISGSYNTNTPNFKIIAKKKSNGATTIIEKTINIADSFQQITIVEQEQRFRSSADGSVYWIKLVSSQKLIENPILLIPHGTWIDDFITNDGGLTWTRHIKISDSDKKGIFDYISMSSKNLSNKVVTTIEGNGNYEIGGFTTRKIIFPPFVTTMPIGCIVTDLTKLEVVDLSGNIYTYQDNFNNNVFTYTIVDSSGNVNNKGDYIKITDQSVTSANSTGTYYLNIQERV